MVLSLAEKATGAVVETIRCTPEHPFFTEQGWVKAGDLGIGTAIVTRAGPDLVVAGTQREEIPGGYAVFNFGVGEFRTYFVGTVSGGTWVHNNDDCIYRVHYQMQLQSQDFGFARPHHFSKANEALYNVLTGNSPDLRLLSELQGINPNILAEIGPTSTGDFPGVSPTGFTWQHALKSQADGEEGVMQLVYRGAHRNVFRAFHPIGPRGRRWGGYQEWAVPAGAPR